jgi:hypothetical protein
MAKSDQFNKPTFVYTNLYKLYKKRGNVLKPVPDFNKSRFLLALRNKQKRLLSKNGGNNDIT